MRTIGTGKRKWAGRLAVLLPLLLPATLPAQAAGNSAGNSAGSAVTVELAPGEDPGRVGPVVDRLARDGHAVTLRLEAPAQAEAAPPPAPTVGSVLSGFGDQLDTNMRRLQVLPAGLGHLAASAASLPAGTALALLAIFGVTGLVMVAGIAVAEVRRPAPVAGGAIAGPPGLLPAPVGAGSPTGPDTVDRLFASALFAGKALLGVAAAYAIGRGLTALLLPDLSDARLAHRGIEVLLTGALYAVTGGTLLAPRRPERRLLPIPHARRHSVFVTAYGIGSGIIEQSLPVLAPTMALPMPGAGEPAPVLAWYFLTGTAISLLKLWWFFSGRHDVEAVASGRATGRHPTLARSTYAVVLAWTLVLSAPLFWLLGEAAIGLPEGGRWVYPLAYSQSAVILVPILAAGGRALLDALALRARHHHEFGALPSAGLSAGGVLVSGGVWVAGLVFIASQWADVLIGQTAVLVSGLLAASEALGALVIAWATWRFFDAYLVALTPHGGAQTLGTTGDVTIQSRFTTVVPLMRNLLVIAIAGVALLLMLSALGVDTGPFLAGAGIVGLAVSFGSQALVKDVVSGVFFMADDAFRLGEYIEIGAHKGTVDRITLRSLVLRHQNGPVHVVPFGQINGVVNTSRDWATVKFTIPLDRATDIELARRTIKKVGQAMLEEAELAAEIIQPLKMQGVFEVTNTAIVCRLKFTARPPRATWVQREGLKRAYLALREVGITFATNVVRVQGEEAGTSVEAAGAAALPRPVPEAG